jgi:SAM-dependent methyltransferase
LAAVAGPSAATDPPLPQFGRYYYEHDCGTPYARNDEWLEWFGHVADDIVTRLAPARVLDAGCALGLLVETLRDRGVEAWGIDISDFAITQVHDSIRPYCAVGSLVDPLPPAFPERFDLVTCIEVIEHMPPVEGEQAIGQLTTLSDRILFSSSPTDFGEATHLNVQPSEHWSALFAQAGFFRNLDFDFRHPTTWTSLYERAVPEVGEIVRRYDRKLLRDRDEIRELRETALELQDRLHELDDAARLARELEVALTRADKAETELAELNGMLASRSGRWFRAYHAARRALGRSS